ncbi:30S ribosomal protein S24e [Candidatus Bathyarchaeota archaeon]|nr:30S ribosomal protein S24e [Candidatus Bathyarchaeota archaeon]
MKINIISKDQNPLMKRNEITFNVDHAQNGGTPSRREIGNQIASILKTKSELVFINNLKTKTGTMVAIGEANVYNSIEEAKKMEPKHVILRNAIPEKKTEASQTAKDAPIKKED